MRVSAPLRGDPIALRNRIKYFFIFFIFFPHRGGGLCGDHRPYGSLHWYAPAACSLVTGGRKSNKATCHSDWVQNLELQVLALEIRNPR